MKKIIKMMERQIMKSSFVRKVLVSRIWGDAIDKEAENQSIEFKNEECKAMWVACVCINSSDVIGYCTVAYAAYLAKSVQYLMRWGNNLSFSEALERAEKNVDVRAVDEFMKGYAKHMLENTWKYSEELKLYNENMSGNMI